MFSLQYDGSALNSSSSASAYFWAECDPYEDDDGKLGGPSAGLLILFATYFLEFFVGAPLNLWLTSHILRKRSKVAGVLPADFFPLHLTFAQMSLYLILPLLFANHMLWQSSSVMVVVTRKAFITITIIQAVLTLNYLPFIIILPLDGLLPARALKCQYQAMALAAAASCSYLQPLLYLYRLGRLT
eukprot:superscaffoldBa00003227_g16422